MYVSREVFHCKPGHAKDLVAMFKKAAPVLKELGAGGMRILTDVSGQPYWTVVVEQEVESIDDLSEQSRSTMSDPRLVSIMSSYHDHVVSGGRELYKME